MLKKYSEFVFIHSRKSDAKGSLKLLCIFFRIRLFTINYLIKIYIYLFISYLLNKNNNKTTKNYLVTIIHKMSSSSEEQLMVHLREIEEAAEEVLSDKQEIVDLDRKRCQQNREAVYYEQL